MNNRKQRRAALVVERKRLSISDFAGSMCGWRGCGAVTQYDQALPPGWSWLISYDGKSGAGPPGPAGGLFIRIGPEQWRHDKTLRPEHTRMLDELLGPGTIDTRWVDQEEEGTA